MKRVEEIIPRIEQEINKILGKPEQKPISMNELLRYIRESRINLENVDKLFTRLKASYRETLGYFPENSSKTILEIQNKVKDLIAFLRENESRYHPEIEASLERVKKELDAELKGFLEKIRSL